MRKLEIPKIERGPLFITRQKFYDGLEILREIEQISSDLGERIAEVERTMNEDSKVHQWLKDSIDKASSFTEETEHLITPAK